ncbi:sugar ABC transporter substrate-binding protein [candidate division WWE3 bacterium]|nr:sugar ABC transporter substrate-binding protein [candidate division WWE3 bacterium]
MRKIVLFAALGLILLGVAGWFIFPNVRSDIIQRLPFLGGSNNGQVTLTYWGMWEPREVIQPLLDEYQRQNPNITIEYQQRSPENHYQTVKSRLGSEGAPDIIRIHASWLPYLVNNLAPIPKDVMTTDQYEQTFYPVNKVFLKQKDSYYGIPFMVDGVALVYNQDIFNKEGIASPPKTWNEFRDIAGRITKKNSSGEITQAGAALGYATNIDYFADILGLMFAQNGVKFVDDKGKVNFNKSISPEGRNLGVEAASFYALFGTSEKSWNPTFGNSTIEFAAGNVGMVLLPNHRILEVLSKNPKFQIGVAEAPQLPSVSSASESVNWANYWVESVSKISPNSKEAWKFLKWLSDKEQMTSAYRAASQVRPFGEPYSRKDLASTLTGETYTQPYVNQGDSYTTWYLASGTYNTELNERIVSAFSTMVENVAKGADVQKELDQAAGIVQQVLDQAGR